eukprot:2138723-Pleurochrysis_carterae.AAC.2
MNVNQSRATMRNGASMRGIDFIESESARGGEEESNKETQELGRQSKMVRTEECARAREGPGKQEAARSN